MAYLDFLSSNKGHSTAIEAIEYLGKNYNLLIFGGQHPANIDFYEMSDLDNNSEYINNNKYINNLINQIKDYRGGLMQHKSVLILRLYIA